METQTIEHVLNGNDGSMLVELSPEQIENIPEDKKARIWDVGLIEPDKILNYTCRSEQCKEHEGSYDDKPKVSISINDTGSTILSSQINAYIFYQCNHCDDIVYSEIVPHKPEFPNKYVVFDETGDYKRPTIESIEDLFVKIEKQAEEGARAGINQPAYSEELQLATRWSEKIGYELDPERIANINQTWRENYLKDYEQGLADEILPLWEFTMYFTSLMDFADEECDGLTDGLIRLLDALPHITIPDNPQVKQGIVDIFSQFENSSSHYINTGTEEQIEALTQTRSMIRQELDKFLNRFGVTKQQLEETELSLIFCNDMPL